MFSLPRSSQKKRSEHGLSGRVLAYFACLIVCCGLLPVSADAVEEKTVRVGLFSRENYHVVDADGVHRGYDYEYLMKIASYTGWNYEFVEGTWDECLSMLERGEIDLMGGVEKNEQRMKTMRFADVPTLYAAACLLQDGTSGTYAYEDFEAFDGMRIGAMRGSSINEALRRYSAERTSPTN